MLWCDCLQQETNMVLAVMLDSVLNVESYNNLSSKTCEQLDFLLEYMLLLFQKASSDLSWRSLLEERWSPVTRRDPALDNNDLNECEPTQSNKARCVPRWQRWLFVPPVPWHAPLPHPCPGLEAESVQHCCQSAWLLLLQEQLVRPWISSVLHPGFRRNTAAALQGAQLPSLNLPVTELKPVNFTASFMFLLLYLLNLCRPPSSPFTRIYLHSLYIWSLRRCLYTFLLLIWIFSPAVIVRINVVTFLLYRNTSRYQEV